MRMKYLLCMLLIILSPLLINGQNNLIEIIAKNQIRFSKKKGIKSKDLQEIKYLKDSKINLLKTVADFDTKNIDTLFWVEGLSSHSGSIYSFVWSRNNKIRINYKSYFGDFVEIIEKDIFSKEEIFLMENYNKKFTNDSKNEIIHDASIYFLSVIVFKGNKIKSVHTHSFLSFYKIT